MFGRYVGYVAGDDPLHDFISRIIRDLLDVRESRPAFRAFRLSGSNEVYAYEEKSSGTKIICKFYGARFWPDRDKAALMARQEYEGLETLRQYNLIGSPHHVVRPLADRPQMWQDQQVWLHGDATPANFLFGHGLDVAAIDLERMKRGDRTFDVGRVAGELQHAFMRAGGDWRRAEPFIAHFLWQYSSHFPDREGMFESVTARAPYYMAVNLLRIARNDYIDRGYGVRLVAQAKKLLRAPEDTSPDHSNTLAIAA